MPLPIVCGLTSYCFISALEDANAVSVVTLLPIVLVKIAADL